MYALEDALLTRVVEAPDISDSGAGLELRGEWPASNHEIMLLRLASPSLDRPVTFCAAIRHQHVTEAGTLQVGVEFIDAPFLNKVANGTGSHRRNTTGEWTIHQAADGHVMTLWGQLRFSPRSCLGPE